MERLGMPRDRRAAQALENPDLDFVRAKRVQAVESPAKARQVLAGQAGDQVRMNERV